MKKIYLFAAAAAMLTACSTEELSNAEIAQQNNAETPVAFSIYTPRSVTRAGEAGTLTTKIVGDASKSGFGVFGYYTNGEDYQAANTYPNFMYNQRVKGDGNGTTDPANWTYEPVKYWPNEYGNAAISDGVDRVSFFAYAPWVDVVPATGVSATVSEDEKNITALSRNNGTGDPIVKYVVDTDPATSVDLLWGVAGADYSTTWGSAKAEVGKWAPFIDLLKPNDPTGSGADGKVVFNLRHALARLNVTIDYIDDANTPTGTAVGDIESDPLTTKIFVREIKIGGFVMKGALNLNNGKKTGTKWQPTALYTDAWANASTDNATPIPNWKAYDGVSDIEYEPVIFKDGRRDGKEGAIDGTAESEKWMGLNPCLLQIEPYKTTVNGAGVTVFDSSDKNKGVKKDAVNLFANWNATTKEYTENTNATQPIFVIPRDQAIDVEIIYDVETVNPKLASFLSDGLTPGLSTQNKIRKKSYEVFNTGTKVIKMQAGLSYTLNIHLGMTSVKVDATVQPWDDSTAAGNAELPANQ